MTDRIMPTTLLKNRRVKPQSREVHINILGLAPNNHISSAAINSAIIAIARKPHVVVADVVRVVTVDDVLTGLNG
jgi:hypothetical protein